MHRGASFILVLAIVGRALGGEILPPDEELRHLEKLKEARAAQLTATIGDTTGSENRRMLALYELTELQMEQSVRLLESLYLTDSIDFCSKAQLVEFAVQIRRPSTLRLLLAASRAPAPTEDDRWIAAKGLANLEGDRAIPRLKEMANDPVKSVRHVVRRELAKLGDKDACRAIVTDLASKDSSVVRQALFDVLEARVRDALPAMHSIIDEHKTARDEESLDLTLLAINASLHLGDRESIPVTIELLDALPKNPRQIQRDTPLLMLVGYTGRDFGHSKNDWNIWWNQQNAAWRPFNSHLGEKQRRLIIDAIIRWARSPASGPYIKEPVAYLVRGEDGDFNSSEDVRMYNLAEIGLLKVRSHEIVRLRGNATEAATMIEEPGVPMHSRFFQLRLELGAADWSVVEAKSGAPNG